MKAGDRIGHGLAAGVDIAEFTRLHAATGTIPRGEALDSLIWLYARLKEANYSHPLIRVIRETIEELSVHVFGKHVTLSDLIKVKQLRHRPPPHPDDPRRRFVPEQIHDCIIAELQDRDLRQRRRDLIRFPEVYHLLNEVIVFMQRRVIEFAVKKRITLEINPSSNWATGALEHLNKHPVFSILAVDENVCVTVNCDDPGTFATRLENEFVLLLEAMISSDVKRADAVIMLGRMISHSADAAFA